MRRDLFLALGGFAHCHPEDLDLVLRLRRLTRLRLLTPPVNSSGRRWLKHGNLRTSGYHWAFLIRHLAERLLTRRWPPMGELSCRGRGLRAFVSALTPSPNPYPSLQGWVGV